MATITEALAIALDHHLAGRLDEARIIYSRILEVDPDQPDALHFLGVLAGQIGELEFGLSLIVRASAFRPEASDIHANRANLLRAAKRDGEACEAYRRALALRPDFAEAWIDLATVRRSLADIDGALASLERALRIDASQQVAAGRLALLLHERARLLVESGRGILAVDSLNRAAELAPLDADIAFLQGNALYAIGLREDSLSAYRRAVLLVPDFVSALFNLGIALGKIDRLDEAAAALSHAARVDPAQLEVLENLALAVYALDREDEANETASRILDLKNRLAVAQAPDLPPLPAAPRGGGRRDRNMIAFSLWGDRELYTRGAVENAGLVPLLFPGWTCRIYHDDTVPLPILEELAGAGAELVTMASAGGALNGLYWRFLVSDDPTVSRFLCRDCDSRLSPREAAAVKEWIASGKPFHVMRDHILHTELMLAGMWGGMAGLLPEMRPLAERFARSDAERWQDLRFLRRFVWPLIRDRVLVHDRTHPRHGRPFPEGPDGPYPGRIGDRVTPP